jgi:DNA-binding transcriptional ArsR family regulator
MLIYDRPESPAIQVANAAKLKGKLFRGFAEPSRLAILEALRSGPGCVNALVEATGLTQPNASNHLACLLDCGLVEREPRGRFVFYRLADPRVAELLALADELLTDVAHGVYVCPRYELDHPGGALPVSISDAPGRRK